MRTNRQLSRVFIGLFIILWFLGPMTQLIQIINLPLHIDLGLSERLILDPEFGWFRADELAIAWADMTYLVAGIVFVIGVFLRRSWSLAFGFYTLATWSFILLIALIRWSLLDAGGYQVLGKGQEALYRIYAVVYVIFGWFGMVYLWRRRHIFD